jgi:sec-independent protein translocase protein TatA
MFRNIGWPEILVVLAIILVVFGAAKLPTMAHSLGKSLTSFKKGLRETADDVKEAIREEVSTETEPTAKNDTENNSKATSDVKASDSDEAK